MFKKIITYAHALIKSATLGATTAAASYLMRSTARINVTVLGTILPLFAATGLVVGA